MKISDKTVKCIEDIKVKYGHTDDKGNFYPSRADGTFLIENKESHVKLIGILSPLESMGVLLAAIVVVVIGFGVCIGFFWGSLVK